jgi:hypothetical protein
VTGWVSRWVVVKLNSYELQTEKMPWAEAPGHFFALNALWELGANADYIGLAYDHNSSGSRAVPGDVSLAVAILADKPLLIKSIGMFGDTNEVDRFIGSRLFGHNLTALFATFSRHSSSFCITYMKTDRTSARA